MLVAPPRDLDLDRVDHRHAPHLHEGVPAREVVPGVELLSLSFVRPLLLAVSRIVRIPVLKLDLARVEHLFVEASVLGEQVVVRSQDGLATYADLAQGLVRAVEHLRVPSLALSLRAPLLLAHLGSGIDILVDGATSLAPLRLHSMRSLLRECSPEPTVGSLLCCWVGGIVSRCIRLEASSGLVLDD